MIPRLLSFLADGDCDGEVEGINDLQAGYELMYGPGDYTPNIADHLLDLPPHDRHRHARRAGRRCGCSGAPARDARSAVRRCALPVAIALPLLPLLANSFGWIFTEMGRQPWIVFGLMPTAAGRLAHGVRGRGAHLDDRLHR